MRPPTSILLATLLLAVVSVSWAQRLAFSAKVRPLEPYAALSAAYETPDVEIFGVRWGPIVQVDARTNFADVAELEARADVTNTIALPGTRWAAQIAILFRGILATGRSPTIGPELSASFVLNL